jgi:glycerate 2-kinase
MKIIKNYEEIGITEARRRALEIIEAGIKKVHPRALLKTAIRYDKTFNSLTVQNNTYDIIRGRIFVVGGGKAVGFMAEKLEEIIGAENITAGIVNCTSTKYKTKKIEIIAAAHPLPDRNGVKGTRKMLELKEKYEINKKDLVICLLSGGGSALMPSPADAIRIKDKQAVTQRLLESGADIHEINTIRKHLSKTKGGRLGQHFYPAKVVSLIISDVVGNDLDIIASGPTEPDPTIFKDAYAIFNKYNLLDKIPEKIRTYMERGCQGREEESPKKLKNCDNYIIGDVKMALETMALKAKSLGKKPIIVTPEQTGEPLSVAKKRIQEILSGEYKNYNVLLFGGETTPKLPTDYGQGGRNQHLAALTILTMQEYKGKWVMASVATDGADYLPQVAGVIVDNNSLALARSENLAIEDYINKYDTNTLFKKMGHSLIITGNTGTNVGDVMVYILG